MVSCLLHFYRYELSSLIKIFFRFYLLHCVCYGLVLVDLTGVVHWLKHSKDAENVDWVVILDADMIIRGPIIPWKLGAEKGRPFAAYYGYLVGCLKMLVLPLVNPLVGEKMILSVGLLASVAYGFIGNCLRYAVCFEADRACRNTFGRRLRFGKFLPPKILTLCFQSKHNFPENLEGVDGYEKRFLIELCEVSASSSRL